MKPLLLLTILLFSITLHLSAQQKQRTWVVRANTGAFIGIGNVTIEKAIATHHSITVWPSFMYFKSENFKYVTYGAGADYRYYFSASKMAPKSFYAGGGASITKGDATNESNNSKTDVKGFTTQAVFGHQWIFNKGFTIDVNAGIQYLDLSASNVNFNGSVYQGLLPALGIGVGYAF